MLDMQKVEIVRPDVNHGKDEDRPGDDLVHRNVLVERNDAVERRRAQQCDNVAADREQNKGAVQVEHGGGTTGLGTKKKRSHKK